jgi:hypothetical protein
MSTRFSQPQTVIPAKAGIQNLSLSRRESQNWTPAFAGVTKVGVVVAVVLTLTSCAHQVQTAVNPTAPGFFYGLWHGFIFPVAWILSLFLPDVAVYAVPNDGGWYDFGYFLGIVVFGVGANRGKKVVYRDRVIREKRTTVIDHQ